ncbi:hypothetical protein HBO14_11145 [Pseudomonas sp. WS 5406]|uniref:hypothetical protein n=1 Tax=Pseudomonas sp. WS 5406 TaxID=2717498 RepID=UPI0014766F83|nr:hypothetical protein [Pseudomonas sp. WS 5406]NMX27081.1 hypothetical protein [Pseudomonas sp. WS 5406]
MSDWIKCSEKLSEVETLATLVLGGIFDNRELGDIDVVYEMPACEVLQRNLVTSIDDVHVELVSRLDYDAALQNRDAALTAEIVAMVESALRRSFSLGQIYWQQADSDSTCQQNKSDQTMEVQAQHILNVIKSINDLTRPTE